ncbi:MAG: hypothetical protein CVV34_03165 [Methanomicrobiales archaeon HGW-Methanomicrobiales-5]|jgi:uncharacterized protein (DUF302 family)|nr:MAG: hypothetical protein CVV34_03165 [Methanomicrobiales archaeon HGW-Methanomicrobiales-5]
MDYYFSKVLNCPFNEAVDKVTILLKEQGFGIITQIDVKETFKVKLDKDFRNYKILGACNPNFAFEALGAEDRVGLMLPCNVIVQDKGNGRTEVAAVNPKMVMQSIGNPALTDLSCKVTEILDSVIKKLG